MTIKVKLAKLDEKLRKDSNNQYIEVFSSDQGFLNQDFTIFKKTKRNRFGKFAKNTAAYLVLNEKTSTTKDITIEICEDDSTFSAKTKLPILIETKKLKKQTKTTEYQLRGLEQCLPTLIRNNTLKLEQKDKLLTLTSTNIQFAITITEEKESFTLALHYKNKNIINFKWNNNDITGINIKQGSNSKELLFNNEIDLSSFLGKKVKIQAIHRDEDLTKREIGDAKNTVFIDDYIKLSDEVFKPITNPNKEDEYKYMLDVLKKDGNFKNSDIPKELTINNKEQIIEFDKFFWSNQLEQFVWGNLVITKSDNTYD